MTENNKPIKIEFQLVIKDLFATWKYTHDKFHWIIHWFLTIFIVWNLYKFMVYYENQTQYIILFIGLLIYIWIIEIYRILYWARLIKLEGLCTLTISEAELEHNVKNLTSKADWGFYEKYYVLKNHYVLSFTGNRTNIIPKRAFSSKEDIKRFSKLLKEKLGRRSR